LSYETNFFVTPLIPSAFPSSGILSLTSTQKYGMFFNQESLIVKILGLLFVGYTSDFTVIHLANIIPAYKED
jgi:hypothetical protein